MIGPAVVDAHDQRAAVGEVGHPRVARQRQRRMRRRDAVEVKDFAIGGQAAVKVVAVPRRQTFGVIARVFFRNVDAAGDHIGRTDPVGAAAFGHRLAVSDDSRARGDAVAGIDSAGVRAIGEHETKRGAGADRRNSSPMPR